MIKHFSSNCFCEFSRIKGICDNLRKWIHTGVEKLVAEISNIIIDNINIMDTYTLNNIFVITLSYHNIINC